MLVGRVENVLRQPEIGVLRLTPVLLISRTIVKVAKSPETELARKGALGAIRALLLTSVILCVLTAATLLLAMIVQVRLGVLEVGSLLLTTALTDFLGVSIGRVANRSSMRVVRNRKVLLLSSAVRG